ncbi:MAG: LLM class flavin-dependent oxidoreductase [Gammaproteobacteria bacterium]|jgi:alkanesulfonate monooxygenase SsuD/methylene tetrahydromethanopterin reductase-like flavin-dependent oxidoreductase (luciferase family)|nr:LLM class flavin-dependent oxidoreductase [Gammaproteobacteria bacterium]MDP6616622.1 LLM class flavin-dependent oxidoreductase [Gammaproteobacteria bacterium]MDP6694819.1 LLM class flavin-dependent oxidoreductase [Gammaproteobacteria bacterium]
MDIDIILECDATPSQVVELAVEAEKLGVRALWTSNYHQNFDGFMTLMPAAMVTSKIILGPLAVSPWELHPLKMANALLTLNEASNGRGMVGISGGGGVLGGLGWKIHKDAPVWPVKHPVSGNRYPERRVRGVQECIEVLNLARSGKMNFSYEGEIFQITRPFQQDWAKAENGPLIIGCCSGPMMVRMGARIADGIQLSDFTVDMMPEAMENVGQGFEKREWPADNFRIGNFWAWHIKEDKEKSMYEARRELIWRGAIAAKYKHYIREHVDSDEEVQVVVDNWDSFFKAYWSRSGEIDNVPEATINKLIAGMSSAGDVSDIDRELERFEAFSTSGLTELSVRLFDDPMDGLKLIGEHVMPRFS